HDRGSRTGAPRGGTRSRDGRPPTGPPGAARRARRAGAPLVPVGIDGTRDTQPPGARLPRPFRACVIRFGRPLDVTRYRHRVDDHLLLRQVTDELMYEIRELSGQQYVDEYAPRRPESLPPQPTAVVTAGHGDRAGAAPAALSG